MELQGSLDSKKTELTDLEHELKQLEEARNKHEETRNKILKQKEGGDKIQRRLEIVRQAIELLENSSQELKDEALEGITEGAEEFREKLFVEGTVDFHFIINEDWQLRLSNSRPGKGLSDGQKMLAAYCVFLAVAKITGEGLPFIIDNPFSKLDDGYRQLVLREVESRFDQAIVFAHPGDLNEGNMVAFEKAGGECSQYQLIKDPEAPSTSSLIREEVVWGE